MLMRSFTRREKVLLLLLAVMVLIGLYVLLVHNPVKNRLAELDEEKANLELDMQVATIRQEQYHKMKAELDEIFAMPRDQITVMPPYDNIEALTVQLNGIFLGLEPNLLFQEPMRENEEEQVITRPIQFTFIAPSYEVARDIVEKLTHTGNRALMDSLSMAPAEAQERDERLIAHLTDLQPLGVGEGIGVQYGPLKVSGTINFYELAPAVKTEAKAEAEAGTEAGS